MNATMALARNVAATVSDPSGWAGPVAMATVPLIPAVALAEGVGLAVEGIGRAAGWLRRKAAAALRAVAEGLDPLPVAEATDYPVARQAAVPCAACDAYSALDVADCGPELPPLTRAGDCGHCGQAVAVEAPADADSWPDDRWTVAPEVEAPAPVEAVPAGPVILTMPSAAQVTAEEAPAVLPLRRAGDDLAELLATHGGVRAAARALGIAESTLRSRCRKAGVPTGRKAKR
jgi:hypothetical protein